MARSGNGARTPSVAGSPRVYSPGANWCGSHILVIRVRGHSSTRVTGLEPVTFGSDMDNTLRQCTGIASSFVQVYRIGFAGFVRLCDVYPDHLKLSIWSAARSLPRTPTPSCERHVDNPLHAVVSLGVMQPASGILSVDVTVGRCVPACICRACFIDRYVDSPSAPPRSPLP